MTQRSKLLEQLRRSAGVTQATRLFQDMDVKGAKSEDPDQTRQHTCVRCHWKQGSPDRKTALCCKFNFFTDLFKNMSSLNVAPTGDMGRGGITYGDSVTPGEDPTGAHLGLRMIAAAISLCLLLGVTLFLFHITKRKRMNASLRREQREQRALYRRHIPLALPYHELYGGPALLPPPPPYPLICGVNTTPKAPDDPPPPYELVEMLGGVRERDPNIGTRQQVQPSAGYIPWNPATLLAFHSELTASRDNGADPTRTSWYPLPPSGDPQPSQPVTTPSSSHQAALAGPGPSSPAVAPPDDTSSLPQSSGGDNSAPSYKIYGFIDGQQTLSSAPLSGEENGPPPTSHEDPSAGTRDFVHRNRESDV